MKLSQEVSDRIQARLAALEADTKADVEAMEQALRKELLGQGRALESFGGKAHLAFLLGMLNSTSHTNLNTIRKIRNHAAHASKPVTFEDPKVVAWTKSLSAEGADSNLRERFGFVVGSEHGRILSNTAISALRKPKYLDFLRRVAEADDDDTVESK